MLDYLKQLFGPSDPIWDEIYVPQDQPIYSDTHGRQRGQFIGSSDKGLRLPLPAARVPASGNVGTVPFQPAPKAHYIDWLDEYSTPARGMFDRMGQRAQAHSEAQRAMIAEHEARVQAQRDADWARTQEAWSRLKGIMRGERPSRAPITGESYEQSLRRPGMFGVDGAPIRNPNPAVIYRNPTGGVRG